MKANKTLTTLAAILAFAPSFVFGQSILINGGFEANGSTGGTIGTSTNTSLITGWSLSTTSGSTAFTVFSAPGLNEPNPADGTHLLNIGGFNTTKGVGYLWQDFATSPGLTYDVSYYFGRGNNDPTPTDNVSVLASIFDIEGGVASGPALGSDASGDAPPTGTTGDLTMRAFQFIASGPTSRILLQDTSVSSGASIELDAVSVSAVPEPAITSLMLGACVIGGFIHIRRRKK